jgi:hypothetical protein
VKGLRQNISNHLFDVLSVEYTNYNKESEKVSLRLTDTLGKTIRIIYRDYVINAGESTISIPVEDLSSGIYFLRIDGLQNLNTIKFVKL